MLGRQDAAGEDDAVRVDDDDEDEDGAYVDEGRRSIRDWPIDHPD